MKFPRLPKTVMGIGGPVVIKHRTETVKVTDAEVWGSWDDSTRTIDIDTRVGMEHQWRVYYHEWMHACLADSGLENLFPDATVEALCDAVSTARMIERFGGG